MYRRYSSRVGTAAGRAPCMKRYESYQRKIARRSSKSVNQSLNRVCCWIRRQRRTEKAIRLYATPCLVILVCWLLYSRVLLGSSTVWLIQPFLYCTPHLSRDIFVPFLLPPLSHRVNFLPAYSPAACDSESRVTWSKLKVKSVLCSWLGRLLSWWTRAIERYVLLKTFSARSHLEKTSC